MLASSLARASMLTSVQGRASNAGRCSDRSLSARRCSETSLRCLPPFWQETQCCSMWRAGDARGAADGDGFPEGAAGGGRVEGAAGPPQRLAAGRRNAHRRRQTHEDGRVCRAPGTGVLILGFLAIPQDPCTGGVKLWFFGYPHNPLRQGHHCRISCKIAEPLAAGAST